MIFDCHTHLADMSHLSGTFLEGMQRSWGKDFHFACSPEEHRAYMTDCDYAVVLAFDAPVTGLQVPNQFVAEYVQTNPTRLFGFASVDPNRPDAAGILERDVKTYGLKGLKLGPIYQDFHPNDPMCQPLYAKANELRLPIMWHQGTSFVSNGPLEKSRPAFLDPVARSFPELTMIIAHMGHPWVGEAISVVRKHPNVYTDISALWSRPWQLYNALIEATEYGITDKLLFGTDFPFSTIQQTIDVMNGLNDMLEGTKLPRVPDQLIDRILFGTTPERLGLS